MDASFVNFAFILFWSGAVFTTFKSLSDIILDVESQDVASGDLEFICRLKIMKVVSEVQGKAVAFLSTLQGCAQCHHFSSGWGGF